MRMLLALLLPLAASAQSPYYDFRAQAPGARHLIRPEDLPKPYATEDASNFSDIVPRPAATLPQAPAGFKVSLYASGLDGPRLVREAPNGDLFVAESRAGRIRILRGVGADGRAKHSFLFATRLRQPFGIAFYPPGPSPRYIYIADTDAVLRFPYANGAVRPRGRAEFILKLPGGGRLAGGGHWTRDVAFSADGKTLFVSVGSLSNVADVDKDKREFHRADILAADPSGGGERVYASGLRNAVGLAVAPGTGRLWATNDERDRLGDNLPPDFVTRVNDGGFYGWPWYYIGGHPDPRLPERHPELKDKTLVPDVLLQPHVAPLGLAFYEGSRFPADYRGDLFVACHGSWNRTARTGYEVARVKVRGGKPDRGYEDFLTGFVLPDGRVWGRPVGVAEGSDGALYVSDDASGSVWRVAYEGR